jgi:hypothetical protein
VLPNPSRGRPGETALGEDRSADPAGVADSQQPRRRLVHVADRRKVKPVPDELAGFSVDLPYPSDYAEDDGYSYALEFEGWALGKDAPVQAIDLCQDGFTLWRMPLRRERPDAAESFPDVPHASTCGFYSPVSALVFTQEFEISVEAVLADGKRVVIATVRGKRAPLRSNFTPSIQPLMVSTTGRSGSTILLRMLANHPEVVAYRPFQAEVRTASFWADVLMGLAAPSNYLRLLDAGGLPLRRGWSVISSINTDIDPPRIDDPPLVEWMGTRHVEDMATFAQSQIETFYSKIAQDAGRTSPGYFVEKCQTAAGNGVPSLLAELYPRSREIVLVRDFRDMICSWLAYGERRGVRDPNQSEEDYVRRWGEAVTTVVRHWERRSGKAHLLRYEDLLLEPHLTIEALLRYLGVDSDAAIVDELASNLSSKSPELDEHLTSESPAASVGRWKRDLSPALRDLCHEVFATHLEVFGYEP